MYLDIDRRTSNGNYDILGFEKLLAWLNIYFAIGDPAYLVC